MVVNEQEMLKGWNKIEEYSENRYNIPVQILSKFPGGMLVVSRMMISVSVGEEDRKSLTDMMAGNVVKHGFSADKRKHSVRVCIACGKETLMLSLKDDCVPFDIEQRARMMDQEDVTKNIGIRLISRVASEMHYQNVLGLNVLTIRLNGEAA